jgi:aryl-alcohol dehydrogenase-like predicted oxidoreductase
MEQRPLGKSGVLAPVVGMGTWRTFDVHDPAAENERREVVSAALAAGITLFDSSPMYGESERVLGMALAGRRDRAFVATKVWTRSPDEAREQMAAAFRYYENRVDLYQVHNLVAWREQLPLLEAERDAGRVQLLGATHYDAAAYPELMTVMRTGRIDVIQIPYNACDQRVAAAVLPLAVELGIGVLVMRPLGGGELMRRQPKPEDLKPLEPFGVHTWAQALLKWALSDPRVTTVIPATSHVERVAQNSAAGRPPWFDDEARALVAYLTGWRK